MEGKGSATIHDVTVTLVPIEHVSSTSETLQTLQDEAERVSHSLTRAQNAISSLESYLKSFTASSVNANLLGEQIDNYEAVGERLDDRVMALKKEQAQLAKKIQEENHRIIVANAAQGDVMTRTKVIVGVFADVAGSVELVLIYGEPHIIFATFSLNTNRPSSRDLCELGCGIRCTSLPGCQIERKASWHTNDYYLQGYRSPEYWRGMRSCFFLRKILTTVP